MVFKVKASLESLFWSQFCVFRKRTVVLFCSVQRQGAKAIPSNVGLPLLRFL